MTSFHPSEATFGCPNAGETMSSTGATVTIRRCDLCCHGQQTVSKSMHRNKDTTVAIARKVLEARSPGSKARFLLAQLEAPMKKKKQLKGRSPGAPAMIQRSKDSKKTSNKETRSSNHSDSKRENAVKLGTGEAQQHGSSKSQSTSAVVPSRPLTTSPLTALSSLKSETTAQSTIVELKRPQPKSASLNSLTVDPMKAEFTLKGGMSSHILINESNVRFAIKIKTSNNLFFRVNPVYSFIDSGAMNELEIYRLPGGMARIDKLLLCYVVANDDDTNAKALFNLRAKIRNISISLITTST
uniref:Major sperm protein n=1 Tax=Parascaris univalens TaxID=6257 RepID=A0A915C9K7_PARUN